MPSQTKRLTAVVTIPATSSLPPTSSLGSLASTSSSTSEPFTSTTKYGQSLVGETEKGEITLVARPHPVTTFLEANLPEKPTSPLSGTSTSRPNSASSWSPSLSRKLRWRLRQHTLWEIIVFIAFVVATIVFFGALIGVGYVPERPDRLNFASGWRAPGPGVFRRGVAPKVSGVFESFLRLSLLGRGSTVGDALEDHPEEESDSRIEPMLRNFRHRAHLAPRLGSLRDVRIRERIAPERRHVRRTAKDRPILVPPTMPSIDVPDYQRQTELSAPLKSDGPEDQEIREPPTERYGPRERDDHLDIENPKG